MKNTQGSSSATVWLVLLAVIVFLGLFRFLILGGVVVIALALLGLLVWLSAGFIRSQLRAAQEIGVPDPAADPPPVVNRRTGQRTVEDARATGASNMRTAWISWHLRSLPPQDGNRDPRLLAGTLAVVPQADWDADRLRQHGRALWSLRTSARVHHLLEQVDACLDRTVAMISDRTDDEFDTSLGQVNDQYLYHPDRQVRTAYLEGGALGVEAIMDAVTAARAQAREDAATRAAAESLAQQRNAALRALRETYSPTENRDAHAAWDEQARKIEE
ncbi:hypothetical protein GMA12_09495 [Kocuria sediminis]|uniref:Uncharacterized protein n=1 Tax=Kocuria sediminis TaxID=1038857 RepID=A0A6N8GKT9_9MICC|nr:hypothetical protein [Kocuria sediminis]MUN63369.1 hypothetical protein [Kocuria sediminis]